MMEQKLITFMRRWKTNKGDPMWQCRTSDGEKVNAFVSNDPRRDTFRHFIEADYSAFLNILSEGEQITWNARPIKVKMQKAGEWWELCGVEMREPDALPDVPYNTVAAFWENKAIDMAYKALSCASVAIFDCETTGLDMATAEIISMGIVRPQLSAIDTSVKVMVKPTNMAAVDTTTHIHGIKSADLESAQTYREQFLQISRLLYVDALIVYNDGFDPLMLDLENERIGMSAFAFDRIIDAMQIVSWYFHEPNGFGWRQWKLVEAAEKLGAEVETAHDALADAITTYKVLAAIAAK